MSKGEQTREAILREALAQSSHLGLRGVTVGMLAERMEMSKSGLFAHFRSKEQLQSDVLTFAGEHFRRLVFLPALQEPRGLPRLTTLFERWLGWDGYADYALPGGCIFVTVAREYDDEPDGPIRDLVVDQQREWLDTIATIVRGAITEGHFVADTDPEQFAHDLMAAMLGYHFSARLLRDQAATDRARVAFRRLVDEVRTDNTIDDADRNTPLVGPTPRAAGGRATGGQATGSRAAADHPSAIE